MPQSFRSQISFSVGQSFSSHFDSQVDPISQEYRNGNSRLVLLDAAKISSLETNEIAVPLRPSISGPLYAVN